MLILYMNEYQKYFLGGMGSWYVGLTTLPTSSANCLEIWEPQLPGNLSACPGLYWHCFTSTFNSLLLLSLLHSLMAALI